MAFTHGMSKTKFYSVWRSMKQRCLNPNSIQYHDYGGRGISLCSGWAKFENFRDDMYDEYQQASITIHRCEIDRIDNNGGYNKNNCRWVSRTENIRNRDNRKLLTRSLSEAEVLLAKAIRNNFDISYRSISKLFGVCRKTIERAIKGKTYRELI